MDRVISDGEVVLGMLAFAALIYSGAYNFVSNSGKPRPPRTRASIIKGLATLVVGFAVALMLLYVLHVPLLWVVALAFIGSVVSSFIERKKAQPVN